MIDVIYNSTLPIHKKPFGAVRENTNIEINININKKIIPRNVKLILLNDDDITQIFDMYLSKSNECFNIYSTNISINEIGLYFYHFEINTETNKSYVCKNYDNAVLTDHIVDKWQLTIYSKNFTTPSFYNGSIMYQIFPDRFSKSNDYTPKSRKQELIWHDCWDESPHDPINNKNYMATDVFGGNIRGIIEKLPYLQSLCIDSIYLNPIFESASNHRYNTADYLNVDPYLGDNNDFKELCQLCADNGIKIILDGVFSHTGSDSIYFNKDGNYDSIGAFQSKESKFYQWYDFINFPHEYHSWWGFDTLPNVNETNEHYLSFITDSDKGVLPFWQKLGAGGWRLDVADELPDLFLEKLRESVKLADKDGLIIGEVWEDASNKTSYDKRRKFLLGNQLDSTMNYPFRDAIFKFIYSHNARDFELSIMSILENYPFESICCLMNSISTHDTKRVITELSPQCNLEYEKHSNYILSEQDYEIGKESSKLAAFLQFTLPGIPCIYYGDEVGLYGHRDPHSRKCYPYGKEDIELLEFYQKLCKIRSCHKEDFSSMLSVVHRKDGCFFFSRGELICLINVSHNFSNYLKEEKYNLVYEYNIESIDNKIILKPRSFCILKKQK